MTKGLWNPNPSEADLCFCDWLQGLHVKRRWTGGVIVRCEVCGGTYSTTRNKDVFESFINELSLPHCTEFVLRFDTTGDEIVE